jgi:hypothetical protein
MHIIFTRRNSSQVFKLLHHLLFLAPNELLSAAVRSVNFLIVFIDFLSTSQPERERAARIYLMSLMFYLGSASAAPGIIAGGPPPAFNNLIAANSAHRFGNNEQSLLFLLRH